MVPYELVKTFCLRTTVIPYNDIKNLLNSRSKTECHTIIDDILSRSIVDEALYIASPSLYGRYRFWKAGGKLSDKDELNLVSSIVKYIIRMGTRCTPFGLFSAVSSGNFGKTSNTRLKNPDSFGRLTALDGEYLYKVKEELTKERQIIRVCKLFANTTIYEYGDRFRYFNYTYEENERRYGISNFASSHLLLNILKKSTGGLLFAELVDFIVNEVSVSIPDAEEYVFELINAQLLTTELEPTLIDTNYYKQLSLSFQNFLKNEILDESLAHSIGNLVESFHETSKIDANGFGCTEKYVRAVEKISSVIQPKPDDKLFQVDLTRNFSTCEVSFGIANEIRKSMNAINALSVQTPPVSDNLLLFKRKFLEKYEYRKVSLLEAIDSDTGIGYGARSLDLMPLLDGFQNSGFPEKNNPVWNQIDKYLFQKVLEFQQQQLPFIDVSDFDPLKLPIDWQTTHDTLGVLVSLVDVDGKSKIMNHGSSGSSAINPLSRFTFASKDLETVAKEIATKERELNQGKIVADVVHLPNYVRTLNILTRKDLRGYHINFLIRHTGNDDCLSVQDLELFMDNERLVLWSKKHSMEVIPKLTTAHNFHVDAHPVYQFLGDFQHQNKRSSIAFFWKDLFTEFIQLPRIVYKEVIISKASWFFKKSHYQSIIDANENDVDNILRQFIYKWRLPSSLQIVEHGDNHLLVDLYNPISKQLFLHHLKSNDEILLNEYFPPAKGTLGVLDSNDKEYSNEFLIFFSKKKGDSSSELKTIPVHDISAKRIFMPGDHWIYFKLYTGTRSIEVILTRIFGSLVEELTDRNLIKEWFFIRYADPEYHLRIRFLVCSDNDIGNILSIVQRDLSRYVTRETPFGLRLQIDTYVRELERYGGDCIELVERAFHIDSKSCLDVISLISSHVDCETKRWLYTLTHFNDWLEIFDLSHVQRLQFLSQMSLDKAFYNQAVKVYNKNKKSIFDRLIENNEPKIDETWHQIQLIRQVKLDKLRIVVKDINNVIGDSPNRQERILRSLIHLSLNRLCVAQPNNHEFIMYGILKLFYNYQSNKKITPVVANKN